jgi:hypothetical protein
MEDLGFYRLAQSYVLISIPFFLRIHMYIRNSSFSLKWEENEDEVRHRFTQWIENVESGIHKSVVNPQALIARGKRVDPYQYSLFTFLGWVVSPPFFEGMKIIMIVVNQFLLN